MFLVLGVNGQLGYELKRILKNKAIFLDRKECDLSDADSVQKIFLHKRLVIKSLEARLMPCEKVGLSKVL